MGGRGYAAVAGRCPLASSEPTRPLVFERDHGAAVAAEGGDFPEVAVTAGDGHHRAIAVDRMAGGGEVPASAFGVSAELGGRLAQRLLGSKPAAGQTKQQG